VNELVWLIGLRCESFTKREFDWVVGFDREAKVVIACLWRLIENGRVRFTSQDDGHQFGLPAPVDAADEVSRRVGSAIVETIALRKDLLDLELQFSTGHLLQIIPDSSGYEAWQAVGGGNLYIAVGGGQLAIFGS
jgi:hypothetical protein